MAEHHQHVGAPRAMPSGPTLSLLRMSAAERLVGAAVVIGALWGLVALVLD